MTTKAKSMGGAPMFLPDSALPTAKPSEPIEVRLAYTDGMEYHLVAWRTEQGLVGSSLSLSGHGIPHSLSSLQSERPFPGKAVQGWQAEVVEFARGGLYRVVEVR